MKSYEFVKFGIETGKIFPPVTVNVSLWPCRVTVRVARRGKLGFPNGPKGDASRDLTCREIHQYESHLQSQSAAKLNWAA